MRNTHAGAQSAQVVPDEGRAAYEPPDVAVIGSLQTLTRGGSVGPGDSFGGAGSSGSL